MKKITSILTTLVLFSITVFAQAPQAFNYQGVARDAEGNPLVNREIGLQISILEDATTIYTETHSVLTSNLGLFAVQVGAGIPVFGTFESISWGDNPHFIEVSMDENGGTDYQLLGSSELLSVPYALYAENGSIWRDVQYLPNQYGFSSGAFYGVDNTKILVGKGNENALSYPSFPMLSMNEDYEDNQFGNRAGVKMLLIRRAEYQDEPTLEFSFGLNQGSDRNFSFRANGASRFFVSGEGNVGIGTVEPAAKLEVVGDGTSTRTFVVKNEGGFSSHTYVSAQSASDVEGTTGIFESKRSRGTLDNPESIIGGDRIGAFMGVPYIDGNYHFTTSIDMYSEQPSFNSYPSYITFKTTGEGETGRSERIRISPEGNLGIGTTSPNAKLQIADGDIYIEDINKGVVMKSPNGQCWRMTIDDDGQIMTTAISCPN